jgi:hypothetical protein
MVSRPRPEAPPRSDERAELLLERRLVVEQENPILDFAQADGEVLLLDTRSVSLRRAGGAEPVQQRALAVAGTWPRDPRGRLVRRGDHFRAYVPGAVCEGTVAPALELQCAPGEAPWPVEPEGAALAAGRNHFVRSSFPPFFAAAPAGEPGERLWLLAGVDGHTRLHDAEGRVLDSLRGSWSDLVRVETPCRPGRTFLGARAGSQPDGESLQAFELVGRQAVAVGTAMELPGALTALWENGDGGARAVVRSASTGRYAAFVVSLACSR